MTQDELSLLVDHIMTNWKIESCIACDSISESAEERHRLDAPKLKVEWREFVGFRRCTLTVDAIPLKVVAQVDLHDQGTIRTATFIPCQLTISPEESLIYLSV